MKEPVFFSALLVDAALSIIIICGGSRVCCWDYGCWGWIWKLEISCWFGFTLFAAFLFGPIVPWLLTEDSYPPPYWNWGWLPLENLLSSVFWAARAKCLDKRSLYFILSSAYFYSVVLFWLLLKTSRSIIWLLGTEPFDLFSSFWFLFGFLYDWLPCPPTKFLYFDLTIVEY